jgi:hypothetical protein
VGEAELAVAGVDAGVDGGVRGVGGVGGGEEAAHLAVVVVLKDEVVDGGVVRVLDETLGLGAGAAADVDLGGDAEGVFDAGAYGGEDGDEAGVEGVFGADPFDVKVCLA